MKFPEGVHIYAISKTASEQISYFRELLEAGVDIVQLRDKKLSDREFYNSALELKELVKSYNKIFIINDRVDLMLALDADGLHIGEKDLPLRRARDILGKDKIIGYSCHNFKDAQFALEEGADYISVGPIFKSPTKKDLEPISRAELELIIQKIYLPQIAIGGINLDNIKEVKELGFKNVAMISALAETTDKRKLISEMKRILKNDSNPKA